ncbi:hypothetical protein DESUT3_09200 [Desulfuromonas versatilis]|uniref:DUF2868 domain-containing protein n=1 Tax=Desulfuromonas versatilis TaxID=2802975 RepID=A0ABN6DXG2_9BACT|nr:DUF2868 domain-containing protein [Desulfuromonas versatilis]BCR03851.1 hypothetical protein DESUT3_09200 [Desulfuromonas versatilis]
MKSTATLTLLADLNDRLQQDETLSEGELRRRDRRIGRGQGPLRAKPLAQLGDWLDKLRAPGETSPGRSASAALGIGTTLLVLAGLVLGWLSAAAVFHYDGTRPVNIIHVLAVFVGAQALLLALLALSVLPEKLQGLVPGLAALQEALPRLSPGRLQRLIARYLPSRYREAAAALIGRSTAHQSLFGRVQKWIFLRSGQAFGLAFNLGALAGCLYLVVFTDLAFGWSTTLQAEAHDLQRLTDLLAWPWAHLAPQGRPSPELIEATRFFRLQPGTLPGAAAADPARLGGWWPFLIFCLLIYGLLPRLALLLLAQARLAAALRHAALHLPGVQAALDRLNSQLVETQASEPEPGPATVPSGVLHSRLLGDLRGKTFAVIDWAGTGLHREALAGWLAQRMDGTLDTLQEAGGAQSLDHDRGVLESLAAGQANPVLILVKGWEPPMADFKDFLAELRRTLGRELAVGVVPLGMGSVTQMRPCESEMAEVWATVIARLGDPRTSVTPVRGAGGG